MTSRTGTCSGEYTAKVCRRPRLGGKLFEASEGSGLRAPTARARRLPRVDRGGPEQVSRRGAAVTPDDSRRRPPLPPQARIEGGQVVEQGHGVGHLDARAGVPACVVFGRGGLE